MSVVMAAVSFLAISEVKAEEDARFSGFVDVSYSDNGDANGTFSLDQVEIDIEKKIDDKLSVRADLQHGSDGVMSGSTDFGVEQAYLTYNLGAAEVLVGVFNAPIGFESLDPVDMYQFSHGLVFSNGLPSNFAGTMVTAAPSSMFDVKLYYVNGWDLATDDNGSKTYGGRVGITPSEGFNVGLSYVTGAEGAGNTTNKLSVMDVDMTITAIGGLTIGAEYNTGTDDKASAVNPGGDAEWTAFSVMLNYGVTEKVGVTFRVEDFDDEDGTRLSDGTDTGLGVKNDRSSMTVAASYALGEGAGMVVEYRTDESSVDAYDCSAPGTCVEKELDSVAVEFTYKF